MWNSNTAQGKTPTLLFQSSEVPAAYADRARRTIAANATNVDDARTLLEMLGLVDPAPKPEPEPAPEPAAPADDPAPAPAVPVPGGGSRRTYEFEWIDTPNGRLRKCRGTCGSPIRFRGEDFTPGTKREHSRGMCKTCSRKAAAAAQIPDTATG